MSAGYEIWINPERTVMVRRWDSGEMEVAFRDEPWHTWCRPVRVEPEEWELTGA